MDAHQRLTQMPVSQRHCFVAGQREPTSANRPRLGRWRRGVGEFMEDKIGTMGGQSGSGFAQGVKRRIAGSTCVGVDDDAPWLAGKLRIARRKLPADDKGGIVFDLFTE